MYFCFYKGDRGFPPGSISLQAYSDVAATARTCRWLEPPGLYPCPIPCPSRPLPERYDILLKTSYGMPGCRYVQWCHGAPSLIPVLVAAAELQEGDASQGPILEAAKKAADVVWERGLLTKARLTAVSSEILNFCSNCFFCSQPSSVPWEDWVGVCR